MGNYIAMAHLDRVVRGTKLTKQQQDLIELLKAGAFKEHLPDLTPADHDLAATAARCLAQSGLICLTHEEAIATALAYVIMTYNEGAAPM